MEQRRALDEMDNEALAGARVSRERLLAELLRVRGVQQMHSLTGADLSYWFERERILERALQVAP